MSRVLIALMIEEVKTDWITRFITGNIFPNGGMTGGESRNMLSFSCRTPSLQVFHFSIRAGSLRGESQEIGGSTYKIRLEAGSRDITCCLRVHSGSQSTDETQIIFSF